MPPQSDKPVLRQCQQPEASAGKCEGFTVAIGASSDFRSRTDVDRDSSEDMVRSSVVRLHEAAFREFEPRDAIAIAAVFTAYMSETFGATSTMTPEVLLRDGQGLRFSMFVAVDCNDDPVGFAAWRDAYDLHHAVAGGEILDLFVARSRRSRALSIRLAAAVARAIGVRGGMYLKSEVLTDDAKRLTLLHRVTVSFPGESVYDRDVRCSCRN